MYRYLLMKTIDGVPFWYTGNSYYWSSDQNCAHDFLTHEDARAVANAKGGVPVRVLREG